MCRKLTSEEFSNKLKNKNPKIYDLIIDLKYYDNTKVRVNSEFGELMVCADSLIEWKELSIKSAINKTDFWIKRSRKFREDSDFIDYSQAIYINNKDNISLRCKIHDYKYKQRPSHHMTNTQGCPYCMRQVIMYNDTTIISHKDFIQNIKGFIYVLILSNAGESFYKVGIVSKHRFEYRLNQLHKYYKVVVKYTEELDMVSAYNLEQRFLKEFKNYKYEPKIKFQGYTECLTTNPIDEYYYWFNNR